MRYLLLFVVACVAVACVHAQGRHQPPSFHVRVHHHHASCMPTVSAVCAWLVAAIEHALAGGEWVGSSLTVDDYYGMHCQCCGVLLQL